MKKTKVLSKKSLCIMTSALLLVSAFPVSVFADGDVDHLVNISGEDRVIGNVSVEGNNMAAVNVSGGEDGATVTVGDITSDSTGINVSSGGSPVVVETGNITGGDNHRSHQDPSGVKTKSIDEGSVDITVNGDIDVPLAGVLSTTENADTKITVNGDVTTSDMDRSTGIYAKNLFNGEVNVTVNDGSIVNMGNGGAGICTLNNNGSTADITMNNGDIISDGRKSYGVYASSRDHSNANITMDEGWMFGFGERGRGLYAESEDESSVDFKMTNGDIVMFGDNSIGIKSLSKDDSENNVEVNGNIAFGGDDSTGIHIENEDHSNNTVVLNGNICAYGCDDQGIYAKTTDHSNTRIVVNDGDIFMDGEDGEGLGLWAEDHSNISFDINGDITISGSDSSIYADASDNSTINGKVKGNVHGTVGLYADQSSEANVIIDGTLSTAGDDYYAVTTADDLNNVSMTVWKIETDNGKYAGNWVYDEETQEYTGVEDDENLAKSIKYIVKIDQPQAGATLRATDPNGAALSTIESYEYANEGDKVLLKVDLQDGYVLEGAYNGAGEKVALSYEDGNYYIIVPRGGGIYFSVELGIAPQPVLPEQPEIPPVTAEWESTPETSTPQAETTDDYTAFNNDIINKIISAPAGGNVTITAAVYTSISKAVVDTILARPDVSITIYYTIGGVTYRITIPAGAGIGSLRNAAGGIDLMTLIITFGAETVG